MPLPIVSKETADSLAKIAQETPEYHINFLHNLKGTNPIIYQYLDYTFSLLTDKYSKEVTAETASIVGYCLALLESQAESDDMTKQFSMDS